MPKMKALILSGGKGTRLKPLTNTITKQLIPVANKPILYYALDQVSQAGIHDVGIVISPETGRMVQEAVGDGSTWGCSVTYIIQPEPLGLAHAVKTAQHFLGDSPFVMHLGDTLIELDVTRLIERFNSTRADALIVTKQVQSLEILQKVGVVQFGPGGEVLGLEEKPRDPKGDHALIGIYLFGPACHEAISRIKPSWRGELEITSAIQELLNMGRHVSSLTLNGWWLDTGKKDDLLRANEVVLGHYVKQDICGSVDECSSVIGSAEIGKNTVIKNSTIRGPVSIADDCVVEGSQIGPFTSIGQATTVVGSSIQHSVVLRNCRITGVKNLVHSLIGEDVNVSGQSSVEGTRLFVGDNARIELPQEHTA